MTQWNGFDLSLFDKFRSLWNHVLFSLRNRVKFSRGTYQEGALSLDERLEWKASLAADELARIQSYETLLDGTTESLALPSQRRIWATFDLLYAVPADIYQKWQAGLHGAQPRLLDAGCQDFSRAPAIQAFFHNLNLNPHLTGVELDAYGMLPSMHSRADRANFFARLAGNAHFQAGDFFSTPFPKALDLIFCFYPFVSPHPALSWGLPYEYGDASKWIQSLERNLAKNGLALVVHQGDWEEEEFQNALLAGKSRLKPVFSAEFQEVFEPHTHPSRIGVYSSEA